MEHSESSILILENIELLSKLKKISSFPFNLKTIISIRKTSNTNILKDVSINFFILNKIIKPSFNPKNQSLMQENNLEIKEEDIASIIYTKDSANNLKGAVITHKAFVTMLNNTAITMEKTLGSEDKSLLLSPLYDIKGRSYSHFIFPLGIQIIYPESIETPINTIIQIKPSIIMGDSKILKDIYNNKMKKVNHYLMIEKKIFNWAMKVSDKYYFKIEKNISPTTREILEKAIAYKIFFSKIYEHIGGNLRFFISTEKPLASEIIRFFCHANIIILEGHGLAETVGVFTINPPEKQIPETVGLPMGDVRLKIASNGKILIKSRALFSGYYKNSHSTSQAFVDDYFCSEEFGQITNNGYLKITRHNI
ncbi:MAG: AMP-binding protein [Halobacteriovoraceae bacterium]|nr:AMP-binding protein [Halobacteriovoraceae bacterium]